MTRVSGFAIFSKFVRACATIVRGPILSIPWHGHHSRLLQRWAVDRVNKRIIVEDVDPRRMRTVVVDHVYSESD
jgi:hypothetical protein